MSSEVADYQVSAWLMAVYLNGTFHDRLTLERGWAQYLVRVPAHRLPAGLNEVTFKYGYVREPAKVLPGSTDTRRLAVAFDYVVLRRAPSP